MAKLCTKRSEIAILPSSSTPMIRYVKTYPNGAFRCRTAQNLIRCTNGTPHSILLVLLELHPFV